MQANRKTLLLVAAVAFTSMGLTCLSINDAGVFSINVKDVTGTFPISQGALSFGNPPSCATRNAADYIDANYSTITGGRLVDILVKTNGTFAGNVNNGLLTINNVPLLRYSGSWNAFNTEQSLLTSTLMTRDATGVNVLLNAIKNASPVTLCGSGAFSQAATSGLSVSVQVFAQLDVQP
jgi:hypothetical protein